MFRPHPVFNSASPMVAHVVHADTLGTLGIILSQEKTMERIDGEAYRAASATTTPNPRRANGGASVHPYQPDIVKNRADMSDEILSGQKQIELTISCGDGPSMDAQNVCIA